MDRKEFMAWLLLRGFERGALGYYHKDVGPYKLSVINPGSYNSTLVKVQRKQYASRPPAAIRLMFRKRYRTYKGAMRRILHYIELGEAGGSEKFEGAVTAQGLQVPE